MEKKTLGFWGIRSKNTGANNGANTPAAQTAPATKAQTTTPANTASNGGNTQAQQPKTQTQAPTYDVVSIVSSLKKDPDGFKASVVDALSGGKPKAQLVYLISRLAQTHTDICDACNDSHRPTDSDAVVATAYLYDDSMMSDVLAALSGNAASNNLVLLCDVLTSRNPELAKSIKAAPQYASKHHIVLAYHGDKTKAWYLDIDDLKKDGNALSKPNFVWVSATGAYAGNATAEEVGDALDELNKLKNPPSNP